LRITTSISGRFISDELSIPMQKRSGRRRNGRNLDPPSRSNLSTWDRILSIRDGSTA
jgi:hypothetical protein